MSVTLPTDAIIVLKFTYLYLLTPSVLKDKFEIAAVDRNFQVMTPTISILSA